MRVKELAENLKISTDELIKNLSNVIFTIKITEEYEQAKKAIKILGGNYKNQVEFYLPQSDIYRNLFIIEKIDVTPKKYPRKAGLPSKEPII